jgi:hypothetical protein
MSNGKHRILGYAGAISFICAVGVAAAVWSSTARDEDHGAHEVIEWKSQVLGWASALLYCEL